MKMNNKGQVLVIFVILLPIFLLILGFVIDYGFLSLEKKHIEENTYDAAIYYLENIDDSNVYNKTLYLLQSNVKDANISLKEENGFVEIKVEKKYNGLYSSLYDNNIKILIKVQKKMEL